MFGQIESFSQSSVETRNERVQIPDMGQQAPNMVSVNLKDAKCPGDHSWAPRNKLEELKVARTFLLDRRPSSASASSSS